ncbi:MAG: efflux transporter outer membrane subunit [Cyclobacteriaceae bacterium]|nr:efflux transporter outer membrane subunit [Cyclobacteriaceae bacterium]
MNNRIIALVTVLLATLLFQACKVGPNFKTPESSIDSTAIFRFDSMQVEQTAAALNLKWWELFDDPVLAELIRTGLEENKEILIASGRVQQSQAMLGYTKAEMWPSIGYSAEAIRGSFFQGNASGDVMNYFTAFGSLNWEIDFWGKFRRANESARAELAASEYGKRTIQIGLIAQIAVAYFQLLDYRMREDISKKTLALRDESLNIILARYQRGIIPEIDVNQAQIQRAIAAAAVPFYQRKVGQTEIALSVLLGRSPGAMMVGSELMDQAMPPDIPVGLPSELIGRRPDIRQAESIAHAQTARIGVAQALRFPSISLTGLMGVASSDIAELTSGGMAWNAGAGIFGPLFEFGKNKRRVEVERAVAEQTIHAYELTVITAFGEVEDALIEINTLKQELEARTAHLEAAKNAQYLSQARYDRGVTSFLELIESQRQAFEAELSMSETTQKLFNGYVELYKALGGGWLSPDEMNAAENQK